MKLSASLLALLLSFNLLAAEKKIASISSNIDEEKTDLLIETDNSHNLDSIRIFTVHKDGSVKRDDTFPVETLISEGVVANEREGRKIVILKVEDFTAAQGGTVKIDYLYNGITGTRQCLKLKLVKVGDSFGLTTQDGRAVSTLKISGNRKPIVSLVGISKIVAN
jgi:hypothetical protein